MSDFPIRPRPPLADCPYCDGEGTDADSPTGKCGYCYGLGRVARILADRILARRARREREAGEKTRGKVPVGENEGDDQGWPEGPLEAA